MRFQINLPDPFEVGVAVRVAPEVNHRAIASAGVLNGIAMSVSSGSNAIIHLAEYFAPPGTTICIWAIEGAVFFADHYHLF